MKKLMKKKSSVRHTTTNIIGGTIAVPSTNDPLNISCRSDLTHDLTPDAVPSAAPPHLLRRLSSSDENGPPSAAEPTILKRDITSGGSLDKSFHTAKNLRLSGREMEVEVSTNEYNKDGIANDGINDGKNAPDDESDDLAWIEREAELAAVRCFGEDAGRRLDEGTPARRSTLVAENSTNDGEFVCIMIFMLLLLYILCNTSFVYSFSFCTHSSHIVCT